ncbi:hypothetical protein E1B28_002175 [Marasmius oreades]|uniref:Uncharacterized protein n=1 Tax=Marasmius oreades TaxID=181124 RepID=A0A9P7UL91_9AGAR|nr:uncharacterized protein E1B28_002175 [Marasmius oreades]KAG7086210.1 hypothetical protein E1B28_002175 [Marasmius oreades]
MTAYSTFFSSGLAPSHDILAAYPRPRPRMDSTSSMLSVMSTTSVSTIKSPVTDDASDVEENEYTKKDERRETTPTPQTPKIITTLPTKKLRRRKSSLSVSPMAGTRSPAKAAESSYQRHLSRSRSGSVSSAMAGLTIPQEASFDATVTAVAGAVRVTGRSRSGSIGNALKPPRRSHRQPPNNPLPPPSAPLPPVPPSGSVTASLPQRKHSRSISVVPRLRGPSATQDLLPPLPPTPASYGMRSGTARAQ